MRCIRCEKPLKRYAKEVTVADGSVEGWGPRCARMAFAAKTRAKATPRRAGAPGTSEFQIDLVEQLAA
jgi:hypothetical protein